MKTIFQHPRVIHALDFAIRAHDGQTRKDGKTLYITHPIGVAALVDQYGGTPDQVITALLHDVVEDCDVTLDQIYLEFGAEICRMVGDLTNTSKQERPELNRAARKALDAERLASVEMDSQFVKLCDIYYNISDLNGLEPGFRIKFLREKKLQVETMSQNWSHATTQPNTWRLRAAIIDKVNDLVRD